MVFENLVSSLVSNVVDTGCLGWEWRFVVGEVVYVPSEGLETRESLEASFKSFATASTPDERQLMGDAAAEIVQAAYTGFVTEVSDRLADQKLIADIETNLMGAHHDVMLDADDVDLGLS